MNPAEKADGREQRGSKCADSAQPSAIRAALVELIAERGYQGTTLEDLLGRLEIDAASFEAVYQSLDACFADVWESFTQDFVTRALAAYNAEESWREGMRA